VRDYHLVLAALESTHGSTVQEVLVGVIIVLVHLLCLVLVWILSLLKHLLLSSIVSVINLATLLNLAHFVVFGCNILEISCYMM